ncbi:unnamed protein product [Arctogadus glacialis]
MKGPNPTVTEIVASDSIKDKSSTLNVEASLKASFLCGLVEIEGSAKYLSDSMSSRNQARVTLKYSTTTKFQHLSMNHIAAGNIKYPDVLKSKEATHVVTGILYGAQAFFVFDRELSQKEDRQDIEGNLKVLIKKIPTLKIDGQGSLNMADKDKVNVDKFSCKFHGDFILEEHPVSFQEAIEVYQSLPKLLGTNGENTVPQKVWLMPLKTLDSAAAQLVQQISDRSVRDAQNVLEDLSELERRYNDAERCTTAQQFPQIKKKLNAFKELFFQYKQEFQNTMARKLPLIRGGEEEESVLAEILEKLHSSPFKSDELNEWMDCKETEIKVSVTLNISPPRSGLTTVTHYTVEFCVYGDDVWHYQTESKAGDVTVSNLRINEEYQLRCRAKCFQVGFGPACECSTFKTLASSPPEKLQADFNIPGLIVNWKKPTELGCGVEIKHYILEYAETSCEVKPEECIWSKLTITANKSPLVKVIPGLQPSKRYTVRVRCDCGVSGLSKEESVVVCTENGERLEHFMRKFGFL